MEQLTKEIHSDKTLNSSSGQIKTVTANQEINVLNKLHGVSFMSEPESDTPEVLQHQLPPKELNPGSFILSYKIGKFNSFAMADLGASINVMPRSIFEHLHLTNLKKTNMLCEMADMSKMTPLGIVENSLVKIDKFLFPSDFVIIDNTPSDTTILGRPFLATIHAKIHVFARKFSLEINEDRISFDIIRKDHNFTNPSEKNFMVNYGLNNKPQFPAQSNNQNDYEESGNWHDRSPNLVLVLGGMAKRKDCYCIRGRPISYDLQRPPCIGTLDATTICADSESISSSREILCIQTGSSRSQLLNKL
ncbi:putative ribonuclease H-like domain-containing protein [Tanacetum coccineum]